MQTVIQILDSIFANAPIYYLHKPDNKYYILKYGCEYEAEASTSIIRLLQSRSGEYDKIKEIVNINTPKLKELMEKILSKETEAIKKHYSDKIKNTNENGSSDLFKDIIKDVSDSFSNCEIIQFENEKNESNVTCKVRKINIVIKAWTPNIKVIRCIANFSSLLV